MTIVQIDEALIKKKAVRKILEALPVFKHVLEEV